MPGHSTRSLVNTVVGFIGPEYLADGRQIIRADLEGTVLVSCTRQSDSPSARGRLGHDGSLVLLIGAGEQAGRTYHLIEDWRAAGTALRLRPTTLASTIELYDRRDNALRANLLAP